MAYIPQHFIELFLSVEARVLSKTGIVVPEMLEDLLVEAAA
jgi:hypothetical protein